MSAPRARVAFSTDESKALLELIQDKSMLTRHPSVGLGRENCAAFIHTTQLVSIIVVGSIHETPE